MKYYFPIHFDGGNRGCEGIAKGTAMILGASKDCMLGLCRDINLDRRLGIDQYVTLVPVKKKVLWQQIFNIAVSILNKLHINPGLLHIQVDQNKFFFETIQEEDIMISTGGDMMCYGDTTPSVITNEYVTDKGNRTVLWGCSMGSKNLTPVKEKTLKKFSLVYARESLSYDFFRSLGLKNVICLPDPAFVLEPLKVTLPKCFNNQEVIGLNLSNYTVGDYTLDTRFGNEVKSFIDYIIQNTDKHILLIPHVFWKDQDDRIIAQNVLNLYLEHSDRLSILNSEIYNYQELRYIISKCYCFIGGRTHAVISSYATCVPAIALGYSIKSKGIARDLGLNEKLVVDCTENVNKNCLVDSYKYLSMHYSEIKDNLTAIMPEYRQRPYKIKEIFRKFDL